MAEEEGDNTDQSQKTEEPTARKLEEARKKGQVVFSKEVTNWAILFAGGLIFLTFGPYLFNKINDTISVFISRPHDFPMDSLALKQILQDLFISLAAVLVLPLFGLAIIGVLSGYIQTGPILSAETIKPKLSKISIIKGFERLFSMRSIVEFLKGIFKLVVIAASAVIVLMPYFDGVEHFVGQDLTAAMFDLRLLLFKMLTVVLAILLVLAVLDYAYQRFDFMKKMRMSKQEIKDEFKQTEGDPMIKGRLRQLREQKARQRMIQSVPEADVVITNPTHYAVALKYDTKEMDAPVMVAKGVDRVAEKIKEVAKENKVPIIENAPLARGLFDSMEIDQMLPEEHYKAVAEVISYVFKLKGKKL